MATKFALLRPADLTSDNISINQDGHSNVDDRLKQKLENFSS